MIEYGFTGDNYCVREITRDDCKEYILTIHYAKRFPSVSYAYGLFHNELLVGVVTYGTPFSSTLRKGLAGADNEHRVLELNRLVLRDNRYNEASFLISHSIKMLPKDKLIISYSDISHNHVGYAYQASNFLYCGLSAKRTDWKIRGKEHLHNTTVTEEFRGKKNRVGLMREKYGDDFYLAPRPRKHRYLYIHGNKTFKKRMLNEIRYNTDEQYPKENI